MELSKAAPDLSVAGEGAAESDVKWLDGLVGEECERMNVEARSSKPLSSKMDHMSELT